MGVCVSTVVTTDNPSQLEPLRPQAEPKSVQEIVSEQPKKIKNFDAEDTPVPCCCLFCVDPNICNLCCGCDCGDCVLCYWCLSCDCCLECDQCCTQCLTHCCS